MKRTRRVRSLLHWTLGILSLLAWWQVAEALSQGPEAANRAAAVQAFNERMDRYAVLRERLEEPLPPFETTCCISIRLTPGIVMNTPMR